MVMPESSNPTRRDALKVAGAASIASAAARAAGGPFVRTAKAATNSVQFGMVGTGSRGTYLLKHLKGIDTGKCVAVCDINDDAMTKAIDTIGGTPKRYKDYRELLADKDVEAVFVTTPLFMHFPVTKDVLESGKHVFCEKSLVFRPQEVHALRGMVAARPKQVLQTGLQRRYSQLYQAARGMIERGVLGEVTHVQAQWHRNPGWKMKKDVADVRMANWRLFREYSGGLTAELASHQIDVADWMLGMTPEAVMGLGSQDFMHDGRDIFDNVQLIFKYPRGRRLTYSAIPTSSHLPALLGQRTEMGEVIMGTHGSLHITVGDDNNKPLSMWFAEPNPPAKVEPAKEEKKEKFAAGATMVSATGGRALPVYLDKDDPKNASSFLDKEMKFAKRWLMNKGVLLPEEDRNPVDTELESFFDCCRTGGRPKADIDVGLQDSIAVILSNLALDQGRMVSFTEIETMGKEPTTPAAKPVPKKA
jgi:predicted dehydrogenase